MKIKDNTTLIRTALVLLTCILAFPLMAQQQQKANALDMQLRKLIYTQSAISQLYVDTVNVEKMTEDAIRGILKELDPHSTYTPKKEVQALNEPLTGSFEGIGV